MDKSSQKFLRQTVLWGCAAALVLAGCKARRDTSATKDLASESANYVDFNVQHLMTPNTNEICGKVTAPTTDFNDTHGLILWVPVNGADTMVSVGTKPGSVADRQAQKINAGYLGMSDAIERSGKFPNGINDKLDFVSVCVKIDSPIQKKDPNGNFYYLNATGFRQIAVASPNFKEGRCEWIKKPGLVLNDECIHGAEQCCSNGQWDCPMKTKPACGSASTSNGTGTSGNASNGREFYGDTSGAQPVFRANPAEAGQEALCTYGQITDGNGNFSEHNRIINNAGTCATLCRDNIQQGQIDHKTCFNNFCVGIGTVGHTLLNMGDGRSLMYCIN